MNPNGRPRAALLQTMVCARRPVVDRGAAGPCGARPRFNWAGIAQRFGLDAQRRRWLRRGALLPDAGKLGVSNAVLDKPGKLDAAEWDAVRRHAAYTEEILSRNGAFAELARVAAAHHERLDGGGYPRGLRDEQIALETRIITTADIFDAISAERPCRGAVPVPRTLAIMAGSVGTAIDPLRFEALKDALADRSA